MRCAFIVLILLLGTTKLGSTQSDLSPHFNGLDGTFVLLKRSTGEYIRHNAVRARRRFSPCSTFKIPHTAILLETQTVPTPTYVLKYDSRLKQPNNWARDFDLQSAFRASALWYYQTMAQRLGIDAEDRFLKTLNYGNGDSSGNIDEVGNPFWVNGSLLISADEQVEFLRRFYEGTLGFSARTTQLTKEIMIVEQTANWGLSAKTGACQPRGTETSNWYIGYIEKPGDVYYFALQIGEEDYGRGYEGRISIARAILTELGILN